MPTLFLVGAMAFTHPTIALRIRLLYVVCWLDSRCRWQGPGAVPHRACRAAVLSTLLLVADFETDRRLLLKNPNHLF